MAGGGGHPEVVRMMREQQRAWERRQQARRQRQHDRRHDGRHHDEELELFGQTAACGDCGQELDLARLLVSDDGHRCVGCYDRLMAERAGQGAIHDFTSEAWMLMVPQTVATLVAILYIPVVPYLFVPGMALGAGGVDLAWRRGAVAPDWARALVGVPSLTLTAGWLVAGVAVWWRLLA